MGTTTSTCAGDAAGTCASACKRRTEKPVEVIPVDDVMGVMGYPMWVVSLESFFQMSGPPRGHQELRREGVLKEHRAGMTVLFISHQWLSFSHPDPEGTQLQELRTALRAVKAGELKPTSEWSMEIMFPQSAKFCPEVLAGSTFLWYDYWSIPQPSLAEPGQEADVAKQMVNAVHTIPRYVRETSYFLILCPDIPHFDTGEVCNFRTWYKRGWCRMEMTSQGLRGPQATMAVQVRSGAHMSFLPAVAWSIAPVGTGEFSVDEDREMLFPVVNALMDRFVALPILPEDTHGIVKRRYFITQRSNLLQGLSGFSWQSGRAPTPVTYTLESPEEEVQSFLRRFKFNSLRDRGEASFGPLHCAVCEQRCRIIVAAAQAGVDVNTAVSEDVPEITMVKGMTALGMAGFRGHLEIVKCLLDLRADLHREQGPWNSLHLASMGGSLVEGDHEQVIDLLLERRADINTASSVLGATPLHVAVYGTQVNTAKHLLARGANANALSSMGGPLHYLAHEGWGAPEFVDVLVKGGADVNAQVTAQSVGWQVLMGASRLTPSSNTMVCEMFKNLEGATPLALAAFMGHDDLCDALLQARADPLIENKMRRSALDLVTTSGSRKSMLQHC